MNNDTPSATIVYDGKEYAVKARSQLNSALRKLDIIPDSVLATRNGELITEDTALQVGDVIKLINIISGG